MEVLFTRPWLRVLSGLLVNLGAGWFGVAFITPNFADISSLMVFFTLIKDIVFGIICLYTAARIEEVLEQ